MKYKLKPTTTYKPTRDELIIDYCNNKKVLHIGASDSPYHEVKLKNNLLLHPKINKVTSDLLGIDIDVNAIEYLKSKGFENIIEFNMNNLQKLNFEPEVIIFGETIEHLMNLEIALTNLKNIMNENTKLIISTPNALWLNKIIDTLFSKEIQHTDHKMIFSYATLKNLFEANDFTVEKAYFSFLNRKRNGITKKIKKTFCRIFKGFSETLVFVVKLK